MVPDPPEDVFVETSRWSGAIPFLLLGSRRLSRGRHWSRLIMGKRSGRDAIGWYRATRRARGLLCDHDHEPAGWLPGSGGRAALIQGAARVSRFPCRWPWSMFASRSGAHAESELSSRRAVFPELALCATWSPDCRCGVWWLRKLKSHPRPKNSRTFPDLPRQKPRPCPC